MDMSPVHGSVVVGVDGSEASTAALEWAVGRARLEGRAVTVAHACGLPGAMADFEDIVANERGLMSVGRTLAGRAVENVRRGDPTVAVRSLVTMGHAETVLLEASESAALLVVGARGRGTVASVLLGSVSARVARESACPVVIVRTPEEAGHSPGASGLDPAGHAESAQGAASAGSAEGAGGVVPDPRPVVVGVDGTAVSSAAVEFAFQSASESRVPVVVLHATWDLRDQASSIVDLRSFAEKVNFSESEERLVAEQVAGLCEKYPDVTVTETYKRGDPVRALVHASRSASLVVVGTRGRRLLTTTLLGSVSRGVVERAYCPVAVVRP